MEKACRDVRFLTSEEIVDINRNVILRSGGFLQGAGKLHNRNSLLYVVDLVQSKICDQDPYPDLFQKAALYAYNIITRHIFIDGNKRTGISCAFFFLEANGVTLKYPIPADEIVNISIQIASNNANLDQLVTWLTNIEYKFE